MFIVTEYHGNHELDQVHLIDCVVDVMIGHNNDITGTHVSVLWCNLLVIEQAIVTIPIVIEEDCSQFLLATTKAIVLFIYPLFTVSSGKVHT